MPIIKYDCLSVPEVGVTCCIMLQSGQLLLPCEQPACHSLGDSSWLLQLPVELRVVASSGQGCDLQLLCLLSQLAP